MRVLVACEFSGIVREAFRRRGHEAWSCDLLDTEIPGLHYKGYVQDILFGAYAQHWDLIIAHPPCTHLAVSGARWFKDKRKEQQEAIEFFLLFEDARDYDRVCIENPIGIMSTHYRKPDQIIQPYQFGHPSRKATCLWLHNLPKLQPTNIVEPDLYTCKNGKTFSRDYMVSLKVGVDRGKERSRTYQGVAEAMATQWSNL
jgi:site-specific DNA-cytosine methylase